MREHVFNHHSHKKHTISKGLNFVGIRKNMNSRGVGLRPSK